jgi:osmoprotectant transport system substrate-binding protein
MTPFSDSNALAVTPAFARRHGLRSIADLAKLPAPVVVASAPEFRTRFEGLVGLRQLYGLGSLRVQPLQIGDQYAALDSGRVDVANVFTTDGQLGQAHYVLLRDPRNLFAFQNVAPVIRKVLVTGNPKLTAVIDAVSRKLTTAAMRSMNAAVAQRHEQPAAVAARFLRQVGLVK